MHKMTAAYLECALWSSTDDDGDPLDSTHSIAYMPQETKDKAERACMSFLDENKADIGEEYEQAGHDLWLTRNGHGAGFWDGDWPEEVGERLTDKAKAMRECYLYVGDDGKLYFNQCI